MNPKNFYIPIIISIKKLVLLKLQEMVRMKNFAPFTPDPELHNLVYANLNCAILIKFFVDLLSTMLHFSVSHTVNSYKNNNSHQTRYTLGGLIAHILTGLLIDIRE